MNKYDPLWEYLKEKNKDSCQLSFDEIKEILGFDIDHSFLTYKNQAKEFGYEVVRISIKEKGVKFKKVN